MADRRMFSKMVVNSARFLRMPPSSRLLYYDLGMAADDDGIVEAFVVMRTTGATEDDLRVLAARGFVRILNDDLVSYILDWKQNNQIRGDRYKPSVYSSLLVQLGDGNGTEESIDNQRYTDGKPHDDQPGDSWETQGRLVEDSRGKGIENGAFSDEKPPTRKRFCSPSVDEVQEYITSMGYRVSAQGFVDYYIANGWKVGKNSMKDWKAAVRTWNSREKDQQPKVVPRPENDISDLTNLYD